MADVPIHNATETLRTTAIGVIFRKTIRGSYASLDLLEGDTHIIALIQFHDLKLKEEITSARSFIRRECKLGSQIHLDGVWQNNRFQVRLKHVGDGGGPIAHKFEFDDKSIKEAFDKLYGNKEVWDEKRG